MSAYYMYYIAVEIRACYAGMILAMALATDPWQHYQALSDERLAKLLLELAANVDPKRFRSHPRKPPVKKEKATSHRC